MSEIKVKLIRSRIGTTPAQKKVLDAMGLVRREQVKKESACQCRRHGFSP